MRLQGVTREGAVILLLAICVFLLLALFSYTPADPGWSHSGPDQSVSNWMGRIGAWLSDVLYSLFGASALWWPGMFGLGAWRLMRQAQVQIAWDPVALAVHTGGLVLLLMSTTTLGDLHFYNAASDLPNQAGGILGRGIAGSLSLLVGVRGTTLIAIAAFMSGFTLFSGMSWLTVMDELGSSLNRFYHWSRAHLGERREARESRRLDRAEARRSADADVMVDARDEDIGGSDVESDDDHGTPARWSRWLPWNWLPWRRAPDLQQWDGDSVRQEPAWETAQSGDAVHHGGDDSARRESSMWRHDGRTDIPWDVPARTPSAKRPEASYTARQQRDEAREPTLGSLSDEASAAPANTVSPAQPFSRERDRRPLSGDVSTGRISATDDAPGRSAASIAAASSAGRVSEEATGPGQGDTGQARADQGESQREIRAESGAESGTGADNAPERAPFRADVTRRRIPDAFQAPAGGAEPTVAVEPHVAVESSSTEPASTEPASTEPAAAAPESDRLSAEDDDAPDQQWDIRADRHEPSATWQQAGAVRDDHVAAPAERMPLSASEDPTDAHPERPVENLVADEGRHRSAVNWREVEAESGEIPSEPERQTLSTHDSTTIPDERASRRQEPRFDIDEAGSSDDDEERGLGSESFGRPSSSASMSTPSTPSTPAPTQMPASAPTPPAEAPLATAAQARAAADDQPTLWTVEHLQSQRPVMDDMPEPSGDLPSIRLTTPADPEQPNYTPEQLEDMAELLEMRLREYGVKAEVVETWPGPVITRFEIRPAAGVKVSKISNLAKDLARSLMVKSVRVVEIIPGKPTVGIEIPNPNRAMIRIRQVLDSDVYQHAESPVTLALGQDIGGKPVVANLNKMPHLLVAGTTGSGKSVGINTMLVSMLLKATPDEVRMIMVDPKMLELSVYDGIPHLLAPVVTDMKEAANALRWCVAEMERRYKLMAAMGVRNIAGFNAKLDEAESHGAQVQDPLWEPQPWEMHQQPPTLAKLPYIVVVIDEFADMFMIVGKKVEELIARLAQKARAAGIHLILATQRPSVDVVTGLIKANIPTRMAFQVSSKIDSRTILDQGGAENLLGHGDMLYLPAGAGMPQRVHGAFVDDDEVHRIVEDWKRRGEPEYIEEILSGGVSADALAGLEAEGGDGDDAEQDALYDEAVQFVTETRRASISAVQRRFKIGYNRAARLVEAMEQAGVVSSMGNNGAREVLAPPPIGH